jgi:ATP-GRASP peptide maturase of grasp-with-spasm system
MILIISQDTAEASTEEVENWLHGLAAEYVRINGADIIQMHNSTVVINNNSTSFEYVLNNGTNIELSKINTVWFRRWQYYPEFDCVSSTYDLSFEKDVNAYRISEFKALSNIFFDSIKNKKLLGAPMHLVKSPSKFEQMEVARRVGLSIPRSLITNDKNELLQFYHISNKKIISKANGDGTRITIGDINYGIYTSLISEEILNLLPDKFFPSLFQEFIEKEVELRIFYINKKSYAMAIFSTLDKQTEIDFRVYNNKKPNRNTPFNLPEEIQKKIILFMENIGLLTGSLDLILDKKNEFIFLEVNPGGQFGMVSRPCNYYLEKVIANELINFNNDLN